MEKLSKIRKGDVALLLLEAKLIEAGLNVFKPLTEDSKIDLIVSADDQNFLRIQCKRGQKKENGRYEIPLRKISNLGKVYHYTKEHVDVIAGVIVETGDVYIFPMDDLININMTSSITTNPSQLTTNFATTKKKIDAEKYRNKIFIKGEEIKV